MKVIFSFLTIESSSLNFPDVSHFTNLIESAVETNGEKTEDKRYFITTLNDVKEFAYAVRRHWSIENQLHWNLDVIFREDEARARKDNSPLNMNVLRKTALNLVTQAKVGRRSKKKMMFAAALNPQALLNILFPRPRRNCQGLHYRQNTTSCSSRHRCNTRPWRQHLRHWQ